VLPAWDIATGSLAAIGLLAAERWRARTGEGQQIRLSLSDVAFAMVGNLGRIAEAQLGGQDQSKDGNYLYGAFGHDFETRDGRRVMVVALTARQWRALVQVTEIGEACAKIAEVTGYDLDTETGRFEGRDLIAGLLAPLVRVTRTVGDPRGVHGHRRLLGPVPDVHSARDRGSALLTGQPDVLAGAAARDRGVPGAGVAAGVLGAGTVGAEPRAGPRRAQPIRCSRSCWD